MADDAADFYTGRSARYRIPHKVTAEKRLDAAEARIRELTGGTRVDVSLIVNGNAAKMWEAADPGMRQDLLALAIDRVIVTKSPDHRGCLLPAFKRADPSPAVPRAERPNSEAERC
ncbi:hypothetical protein ACIQAD_27675 [Streptomyces sp. NPDC088551]|uniref:hypothetical protein n=1 Tax=Streptomyces sp. NPDC088551 TaxID=3365863 RepID=UPI003830C26C